MYGQLDRGGCQSKGEPRVVTDRVGLVESIGKSFEVGGEGSDWDRVIRDCQRDRASLVNYRFEGSGKGAVGFSKKGGRDVG